LKLIIWSIVTGAFYSALAILMQLILSASFYVVMHRFFDYLNQKLVEEN
jgi:hypothetical protein